MHRNDDEHKRFRARSAAQRKAIKGIKSHSYTVLIGPAGCGKTLISCWAAHQLMADDENDIDRLVMVRLAAETCGESIGALPGELDEKLSYMAAPLVDNLVQFLPRSQVDFMLKKGEIEVIPVSHLRGRSFQNTVLILEEAQNLSNEMILTTITRLGEGSKLVINGDPNQVDIPGRNGIVYARDILQGFDDVCLAEFGLADVQRHPMVEKILSRVQHTLRYPYPQESTVWFGTDAA